VLGHRSFSLRTSGFQHPAVHKRETDADRLQGDAGNGSGMVSSVLSDEESLRLVDIRAILVGVLKLLAKRTAILSQGMAALRSGYEKF